MSLVHCNDLNARSWCKFDQTYHYLNVKMTSVFYLESRMEVGRLHSLFVCLISHLTSVIDRFDVESIVTGFGSQDWEQTHAPAMQTAVAIDLILKAGAVCAGKQTMDEFGLRYLKCLTVSWGVFFNSNEQRGSSHIHCRCILTSPWARSQYIAPKVWGRFLVISELQVLISRCYG